MLGVRRATVTLVAATLQRAGFIQYARAGVITIANRRGLEGASCECYQLLSGQFAALLPR